MSNVTIKGLPSVEGHYLKEVLGFVMLACPKPEEDDDSLSHVVVTTDLDLVACDGDRVHVGHLPADCGVVVRRSFGVTRSTVEAFLKLLKAACGIVGKDSVLSVYFDTKLDGEPGLRAIIECQGELWPWSFSRAQFLGPIQDHWTPAVPADAAPILSPPAALRGRHLGDATSIDETVATMRQAEPGGPVRVDLTAYVKGLDEMVVATAILLPVGTRARFMDQRQKEMFAAENPGDEPGRSVLSVVIDSSKGVRRPGLVEAAVEAFREAARATGAAVTISAPGLLPGEEVTFGRKAKGPAAAKRSKARAFAGKEPPRKAPNKRKPVRGKGRGR